MENILSIHYYSSYAPVNGFLYLLVEPSSNQVFTSVKQNKRRKDLQLSLLLLCNVFLFLFFFSGSFSLWLCLVVCCFGLHFLYFFLPLPIYGKFSFHSLLLSYAPMNGFLCLQLSHLQIKFLLVLKPSKGWKDLQLSLLLQCKFFHFLFLFGLLFMVALSDIVLLYLCCVGWYVVLVWIFSLSL